MDTIIDQLSEIENASSDIIKNAELQKQELEKANQKAMDELDASVNKETEAKVSTIRSDLEKRMTTELSGRQQSVDDAIKTLQNEFESKHAEYAKAIVKQITEV